MFNSKLVVRCEISVVYETFFLYRTACNYRRLHLDTQSLSLLVSEKDSPIIQQQKCKLFSSINYLFEYFQLFCLRHEDSISLLVSEYKINQRLHIITVKISTFNVTVSDLYLRTFSLREGVFSDRQTDTGDSQMKQPDKRGKIHLVPIHKNQNILEKNSYKIRQKKQKYIEFAGKIISH